MVPLSPTAPHDEAPVAAVVSAAAVVAFGAAVSVGAAEVSAALPTGTATVSDTFESLPQATATTHIAATPEMASQRVPLLCVLFLTIDSPLLRSPSLLMAITIGHRLHLDKRVV